jgi:hypothetical protein
MPVSSTVVNYLGSDYLGSQWPLDGDFATRARSNRANSKFSLLAWSWGRKEWQTQKGGGSWAVAVRCASR